MRRHSLALAVFAAALLATRAGAAPRLTAEPPAQVVPGQEIVLRWSDLPPAVHEVEILLSLDGGQSFPVRLSPELDARDGEYRWRVPAVASGMAVLRLRLGTRSGEQAGPSSRPFRIAAGAAHPARALAAIGFVEQPLWSSVADPMGGAPSGIEPPEARITASEPSPSHGPSDPSAAEPVAERGAGAEIPSDALAASGARQLPTRPERRIPLRL